MLNADQANWIVVAWMAVTGSVIGSFLNVVVYRLPLGLSLSNPPSHCPKCKHMIRWYNNVPVLGWIWLRGRCRDCGNPISARYPLVEAVTGLIFGILTACEFITEGANLPGTHLGPAGVLTMPQLFSLTLFHLLLMCILLCAALIELDGQRAPLKLFLPGLVVGLATMFWPALWPEAAFPGVSETLAGAINGFCGMAAGAAAGGLFWWAAKQPQPQYGSLFGLPLIGLFLGWQAAVVLAVASTAVYGINWVLRRAVPQIWQIAATAWLLPLTLAWLLYWKEIAAMWQT